MLANFLIGFREALEASLVVGILIAYLYRTGHRSSLRPVWIGVSAAVLVSLIFGGLLSAFANDLADRAEPIFAGLMGVIAVAFVTYMVLWMRRSARSLRGELEGKLSGALGIGALALGVTAFIAVAREGLETALFLWSNIQTTTGGGTLPLLGALVGILAAVALEYLLYRSAVRVNLAKFFRITGALLIVVAAGVLAGAVGDLQEANWLPGDARTAFDVSAAVPEDSWYGVVLKGFVGFRAEMTWLMVLAWLAYLVPVLSYFLSRANTAPKQHRQQTPTVANTSSHH